MRFDNKVCIVTGGGSGIGRATCIRMAAEGGRVVIADRDKAAGDETVDMIRRANGEALSIATDIGHPDQIAACVDEVIQKYGKIDVLVNNAAMMTFDPILELTIEQWDMVMNVNLRSAIDLPVL
jgi:glucose 1-dehydrogenase